MGLPDYRNWQQQDGEVEEDIERGVDSVQLLLSDALSAEACVPEEGHRLATECCGKGHGDADQDVQDGQEPYAAHLLLFMAEFPVEEDDRDFDEEAGKDVQQNSCIHDLEEPNIQCGFDVGHVVCQSISCLETEDDGACN